MRMASEKSRKDPKAALPSLHSEYFAPDYIPALAAGVKATTSLVMDILKKE